MNELRKFPVQLTLQASEVMKSMSTPTALSLAKTKNKKSLIKFDEKTKQIFKFAVVGFFHVLFFSSKRTFLDI